MTKNKMFGILAISSFITSTLTGVGAAILNDFYPELRGIHFLLVLKSMSGTLICFLTTVNYFSTKGNS